MTGVVHILCDENIPWETVTWLTSRCPDIQISHIGHFLAGATDREVFEWASQHHAIIVTYDSDFSDLRSFPLGRHFGIVRLRVWPTNVESTNDALERFLQALTWQEASGALVIVDARKVRVRYPAEPQQ